jgi:hypothetical protein
MNALSKPHSAPIDFRNPTLPLGIRAFNAVMAPFAERLFPLDADDMIGTARRRTGLEDLGPDFRLQYDTVIDALNREAELSPLGRFNTRFMIMGLLEERLRAERLLTDHPEILDRDVSKPIMIFGLPRSGTTLLQRLIAQDPGLRHMKYWESNAPVPPRGRRPDLRRLRARFVLGLLHLSAPLLVSMHEMEVDEADEELWLLGIDFATQLFEGGYWVPSHSRWIESADLTATYEYLKKLMQIMSWFQPPDDWVLKTPQHMEHLPALRTVFPDATLVQTHRDPVTATASLLSTLTYAHRFNTEHPDPIKVGRHMASRVESMLRRSVEDRSDDEDRFVDVDFRALIADPMAVVARIYDRAGRELTSGTERTMRTWLDANHTKKQSTHHYDLRDFGLEPAERRRALRFYSERFDVPDDDRWAETG